uniref:Ribosome biogenesis protein NOP53 n=1 Tax=Macrostomum lignano TaxID=282301 RepID=A0A1I8FKG6_9PLAT
HVAPPDQTPTRPAEYSSKSRKALHRLTPALAELAKTAPKRSAPRDPRHDPLVNGRCVPAAWDFLREERRREANRLEKWLKRRDGSGGGRHQPLSEEERERAKSLLLRLRQLERREQLRDSRRGAGGECSGRVSYLSRAQLRAPLEAAKTASLSEKARQKLEKRKAAREKKRRLPPKS